MPSWSPSIEQAWLWGAVPFLALVAAVLLLLLRFPTFTRLADAVRTVRAPAAPGAKPDRAAPAAPVFLAAAASLGAGAAVAGATAVSLGGAGSLAWLWLFGILLAPLRVADVLLARTSPPGRASGEPAGSLVGRLEADPSAVVRGLGGVLLVAMMLAATLGVLAVHGQAVREISDAALPGSSLGLGVGVAVVAGALALFGRDKPWLGWLAGVAVVALLLVGFVACLADPSRAGASLVRAIEDAMRGASPSGAFSGALAAEVALAAFSYVLPPLVLTLGTDGALHADARGATKSVASTALLSTLAHVVVATIVGVSLLATGAFARRVEGERRLDETSFVDAPFDTASQRLETERAWTGYLRVLEGRPQADPLDGATDRGMISETRFVGADGEPGNFALRVRRGRAVLLLVPDDAGALQRADGSVLHDTRVTGRMLPRGGGLIAASMERIGGDVTVRLALAILLVLAAVGAAAIGIALARSIERRVGKGPARGTALAPALAIAAACALGSASGAAAFPMLGLAAVTLLAVVFGVVVLAKSVEVSRL